MWVCLFENFQLPKILQFHLSEDFHGVSDSRLDLVIGLCFPFFFLFVISVGVITNKVVVCSCHAWVAFAF